MRDPFDPLSIKQKISLLTGLKGEYLLAPAGTGYPDLRMSRGLAGLCLMENGAQRASTGFPSFDCIAQSFDPELAHRMGEELAAVFRDASVQLLLLPETLDEGAPEEAFLTDVMLDAVLEGLSSGGVGAVAVMDGRPGERIRSDIPRMIRTNDPEKAVLALSGGADLIGTDDPESVAEAVYRAVETRALSMEKIDTSAKRILSLFERFADAGERDPDFFEGASHHFSRRAVRASAVLLRNEGTLPLKSSADTAFIGLYAMEPPCLCPGDDRVEPLDLDGALFSARSVASVGYAQGFREGGSDPALLEEAVELARRSENAVLFLGMPEELPAAENARLPREQLELLEAVRGVCGSVTVVLHAGAVPDISWMDRVNAVLYLPRAGEAAGGAAVDLLYGAVAPYGKLTRTLGASLPFGSDCSAADFRCSVPEIVEDEDALYAVLEVSNDGRAAGTAVVQAYRQDAGRRVLCGFKKVTVRPGRPKTVRVRLSLDKNDPEPAIYAGSSRNDARLGIRRKG